MSFKRYILILGVASILGGCASGMNEATTKIKVYSTLPSKVVFEEDTIATLRDMAKIEVARSSEPIELTIKSDSSIKKLTLEPHLSFFYWGNLISNLGIGMLIDGNSNKRFSYPKRVYLNSSDSKNEFFNYSQKDRSGQWQIHLSLPYINSFSLSPQIDSRRLNTGFLGLSLGLDYYYQNHRFINASITTVTDFFMPLPVPVTVEGEYEQMSSDYLSLSHNHRFERLSFGYGLALSWNSWSQSYLGATDPIAPISLPVSTQNFALGLHFPLYFEVLPHFQIGIIYRPTLYRPMMLERFQYEHLISLDLAWKIKLNK